MYALNNGAMTKEHGNKLQYKSRKAKSDIFSRPKSMDNFIYTKLIVF